MVVVDKKQGRHRVWGLYIFCERAGPAWYTEIIGMWPKAREERGHEELEQSVDRGHGFVELAIC